MIYSILIYRDNKVIHFEEMIPVPSNSANLMAFSPKSNLPSGDSHHLLMGMVSAACGIASMLAPGEESNKFESLFTPEYRLDFFETVSGYKFLVLSAPTTTATREDVIGEFERLYNLLFVPLVIRNPLFNPSKLSGNLLDSSCHVFVQELRKHFQCFDRVPAPPQLVPPRPLPAAPTFTQTSLI